MPQLDKVNCRVLNLSDGSNQLVFTLDNTDKCVGEIIVRGDENYLRTMTKMFNQWVDMRRPASPIAAGVRQILNHRHANQNRG